MIIFIKMTICSNLDREKLCQLIVNMLGIYILYFLSGILHESVYIDLTQL